MKMKADFCSSGSRSGFVNREISKLTYSYHNNNPEGIHTLMMLFSDRGTPASLRNMNSYGNHTYKLTKEVRLTHNQD
jgi:catalase